MVGKIIYSFLSCLYLLLSFLPDCSSNSFICPWCHHSSPSCSNISLTFSLPFLFFMLLSPSLLSPVLYSYLFYLYILSSFVSPNHRNCRRYYFVFILTPILAVAPRLIRNLCRLGLHTHNLVQSTVCSATSMLTYALYSPSMTYVINFQHKQLFSNLKMSEDGKHGV